MLDYLLFYLKDSNLMSELDLLFISNVGQPLDSSVYKYYEERFEPKTAFMLYNHQQYSTQLEPGEIPTLKLLHAYSRLNPDAYVLYLHTKDNSYPDDSPYLKNIGDWVNYMLYFLVRHYQWPLIALKRSDIVGCNYGAEPRSHFSGNFWWARTSYIQKLDVNNGLSAYEDAEFWPLTGNPSILVLHSSQIDHYLSPYPIDQYWVEAIPSSWQGHRKFAEWLVSEIQPSEIVELGVDRGYSLFVFASAIRKEGKGTITGIDCFDCDSDFSEGNKHQTILKQIEEQKLDNVKIIRATFDEASKMWSSTGKKIDILHIDGNHAYEAVKGDFNNWFPFVSPDGIVLFHDTNVSHFGVKDFFAELTGGYRLAFLHSYGLGVYTHNSTIYSRIRQIFDPPVALLPSVR